MKLDITLMKRTYFLKIMNMILIFMHSLVILMNVINQSVNEYIFFYFLLIRKIFCFNDFFPLILRYWSFFYDEQNC